MIVDKLPIERIDDMEGRFYKLKRCLCLTRINIHGIASMIIRSKIFEALSLLIIVINSVFLAIEDPTQEDEDSLTGSLDTVFLSLYTIEMGFKILGMGFAFNRGAYLRDAWNVLDFVIVVTGYLQIML